MGVGGASVPQGEKQAQLAQVEKQEDLGRELAKAQWVDERVASCSPMERGLCKMSRAGQGPRDPEETSGHIQCNSFVYTWGSRGPARRRDLPKVIFQWQSQDSWLKGVCNLLPHQILGGAFGKPGRR